MHNTCTIHAYASVTRLETEIFDTVAESMEKFSDLSNESSPNVALSESTASSDSSEERESEDSLQARESTKPNSATQ